MKSKTVGGSVKSLLVLLIVLATLSLSSLVVAAEELTILYTNDMHARLEPFKPYGAEEDVGGLTRLATLVKQIEAENPDVLLLNAGDSIHGTNLANLFGGAPVIEVMNAMGFDAMTLGNHEFNYGQEVLKERIAQAEFPVLGANVLTASTGEPLNLSAVILQAGGLDVGIMGLSPQETPIVTHPKNVEGLRFSDPIERARSLAKWLEPRVDLIVALSHLGYEKDLELAESVPSINIIVGGHSHTRIEWPVKYYDSVIVQAGELTKDLGYLKVEVSGGKVTSFDGKLIPVTAFVPADPEVSAIVDKWNAQLKERLDKVVGTTAVGLEGERADVRTRETNLGNLVADVMRQAVGADIALTNGGGIRASIDEGPVTVGEIYTAVPFDNTLVLLELTGEQILAALEHSVDKYPEASGAFLHVSGLKFSFDPSKAPGSRVASVEVGGAPLRPDAKYKVATNDFLAAGGDGYSMFKSAPKLVDTGEMLRDAIAAYVGKAGSISPSAEGRITVVK